LYSLAVAGIQEKSGASGESNFRRNKDISCKVCGQVPLQFPIDRVGAPSRTYWV